MRLVGVLLFVSSLAHAHAARTSLVWLDLHEHDVGVEMRLPLSELGAALRMPLRDHADDVVTQHGAAIAQVVQRDLHATTLDGRAFSLELGAMAGEEDEAGGDVVVHATLRPPAGASPRHFLLLDEVIGHEVMNHVAFVAIRSDFRQGGEATKPELIGASRYLQRTVVVKRAGGIERGFGGIVRLGVRHIADGTDHLLFLLVLLLPAPLLIVGRRWGGPRDTRGAVTQLLKTVTAFTLGHSITLVAGAVGWLRLPVQPVEVLIALSILVSAAHAIRPIFAGREPWVAAGFGLVHGLAFATVIAELGLARWHLTLAILGFNLGIELMQLVVVALLAPWLLLLARTGGYAVVRVGVAGFAGVAAIGWALQRALGWRNPVEGLVAGAAHHAVGIVVVLALLAVVSRIRVARVAVG